jgi:3',5'-cyclic AMP phosphodiesterase CpdA
LLPVDDALKSAAPSGERLLYFWAFGDLHYYAPEQWRVYHAQRLAPMYRDLRELWLSEGAPAFCVSPGDIVETSAPENYQLAKRELIALLGNIPFYPGLGNHELWPEREDDIEHVAELIEDYVTFWDKPARYYWTEGSVLCVMLDVVDYPEPRFSGETLAFLQTALAKHPAHIAVIFAHCPLYNTVLDRDPERRRDYHSLLPFFFIHNSEEASAILARHGNGCLYISGHTHSGWQAPNLVMTGRAGRSPVTHVNLMSPWFTGYEKEPGRNEEHTEFEFYSDEPDLVVSFAFHIYREKAIVRLRNHRERRWMAAWNVPLL